ncbi:MAG: hypothetical protein ACE5GK_00295 [Nitrospiria bacterium]
MKDKEYAVLELQEEAMKYIIRAIANLAAYENTRTHDSQRFLEWIKNNRTDLFDPNDPKTQDDQE